MASAAVGWKQAASRTSDALGGFQFGLLDRQVDTNRAAVLQIDRTFLESLDAVRTIDHGLATDDLVDPRLKVSDGVRRHLDTAEHGIVVPPAQSGDITQVRPFRFVQGILSGMTVIANHVGPRTTGPLSQFVNDAARVSSTATQVNVYMSESDAGGFGRHWDDHDVVILQCEGRKFWQLFAPAALSPLLGYVDSGSFGDPVWSGVLEPGDGLYIPRGWGHEVSGFSGSISVHYTVGLRRMTALDLLTRIIDAGVIPAGGSEIADGNVDLDQFQALDLADWQVEDAYGRWRSRLVPELTHGPFLVAEAMRTGFEGWSFFAPAVENLVFTEPSEAIHDEIVIAAVNTQVAVHRRWAALLGQLLEGEPLPFERMVELSPCENRQDVVEFAMTLASRDLLQLRGAA